MQENSNFSSQSSLTEYRGSQSEHKVSPGNASIPEISNKESTHNKNQTQPYNDPSQNSKFEFPTITFPRTKKDYYDTSLEYGFANHFIIQKQKRINEYPLETQNFNSQNNIELSFPKNSNDINLDVQNKNIDDFDFFSPHGSLRYLRPPIREFSLDPSTHLINETLENMEKQIRFFEPTLDVPPAIIDSFLTESLSQDNVKDNLNPFVGNRAGIFIPECLGNDHQINKMKWLAYTGGKVHNELRFYPIIHTEHQFNSLKSVKWDGLNLCGTYNSKFLTPINQITVSPVNKEFIFTRTHDQVSLIETALFIPEDVEPSFKNPLKYGAIGNPYLASIRNRFIIHCDPSKYDSTEVVLSSADQSVRIWDFNLRSLHSVIGTTDKISVYDMRFCASPLLSWKHNFVSNDPPVYLDTTLPTNIKNQSENGQNICSIFAGSRRNALISTYTYCQSSSNGSPIISLDQSKIKSFHSHESNKAQLLDNISQSQFLSDDLKKKIQRCEIYPFPKLDGFVVEREDELDSLYNPCNGYDFEGGTYTSFVNIWQISEDGSIYSQKYRSLKPSQAENISNDENENFESGIDLLSKYLSDPSFTDPVSKFDQLHVSQVCRDLNLNLIDGNGQNFISFSENFLLEEKEKILSGFEEWPFIRRDFRPSLKYLYGLINGEKMWFSRNEVVAYKLAQPFIDSEDMINAIDCAISNSLDQGSILNGGEPNSTESVLENTLSSTGEKANEILEDTMTTNLKDSSKARTKNLLVSEVIESCLEYLSKTHIFDKNGKLVILSNQPKHKYLKINTKNLMNPITVRLTLAIESRLTMVLLESMFKDDFSVPAPNGYMNPAIDTSGLEKKVSQFDFDSISVFGVGKVGIYAGSKDLKRIYSDCFNGRAGTEQLCTNLVPEIVSAVMEKLRPAFKTRGTGSAYHTGFFENSLSYFAKRLFFSSSVIMARNPQSTGKASGRTESIVGCMGRTQKTKIPSYVKVLGKLWDSSRGSLMASQRPVAGTSNGRATRTATPRRPGLGSGLRGERVNNDMSANNMPVLGSSSQIGASQVPMSAPTVRIAAPVSQTQNQSQLVNVVSASQMTKSQIEKRPKKKSRKMGF
ncbi:hypothetical protein AYI68_g1105 [Smittium mucronatum]|uniref:WD repeat-containing protein n=1 Tax=Smittium mucronatum TaxID=133383 RepID=A0A1R0H688_9FUNG|nr:hypothetical protein AYI68_g1105 [Smittium mucronatum]